jgi:hypothetical protein
MMRAMSRAGRVNVPGGGKVETVATVCTHRRLARRVREPEPAALLRRLMLDLQPLAEHFPVNDTQSSRAASF